MGRGRAGRKDPLTQNHDNLRVMSTDELTPGGALTCAADAYAAGRFAQTESLCLGILDGDADHFEALHLLAGAQYRLGRCKDALAGYERLIALRPDRAEPHLGRGVALYELKRPKEALASYDRALAIDPDNAEAHDNRGIALRHLKRPREALACYDKALAIRPGHAGTHHRRGSALLALGDFEQAMASFEQALALGPDNPDAHYGRGIALHELSRFAEAVGGFEQALALRPRYAEALHRRSMALRELLRFEAALADCDTALAICPDFVEAHISRGLVLKELRRFPEAFASFGKAQDCAPDNADAHWQEALLRLLTGDLIHGFAKYEWRQRRHGYPAADFAGRPQWDGMASLYNKTILLHGDGRLSDTIQFCRYAPLIAARGARVILQVAEPLRTLMKSLGGVAQVVSDGEVAPDFDLHCAFASLPFAFGTKLETIPSGTPYLRPPTEALLAWETRLGTKGRRRVGLAWAGDRRHDNDRTRSLELRTLTPLFELGATFVRLQKNLPARDEAVFASRGDIIDQTELLNDLCDTAALISRLDLVIAVDTSVAHLAGAMAKPVWLMLPYTPDGRWLLGRNTSTWYPTARLYRQAAPGDWDDVIRRVAAELSAMLARDSAARPTRKAT
jgi:tetratricopeptide (TPR) repeat protein